MRRWLVRLVLIPCCILLLLSSGQVAAAPVAKVKDGGVTALAFSPDGTMLASAGADAQVILWDVAKGKQGKTLKSPTNTPVTGVAFSPDGKTLATVGQDSVLRLWDVTSGKELRALTGHESPITSVAFSPDGKTIATGGQDTQVLLWDAVSGKLRGELHGHRGPVEAVSFSPDSQTIASGGDDDKVNIWDVPTKKERWSLGGHVQAVTAVAFSADGSTVVSGSADTKVKLWDPKTGKERETLPGDGDAVRAVAVSADGKTVVSAGENTDVEVWDAPAGKKSKELKGHSKAVNAVIISSDGATIASGSKDGSVIVWDAKSGKQLKTFKGHAATNKAPSPQLNAFADQSVVSAAATSADQGPGGPILVVTSSANPFGAFYAEILRNEGFNEFTVSDIAAVTATTLASYDLVILADEPLAAAQVSMFTTWVNGGGNLIAMHPDKQMAGLLGLTDTATTLTNGYLLVNTASGPGVGIVNQTMQFHGTADRYTLNGATSVAALYSDAHTTTTNPAVTLRAVGANGGQVAAFTFDLARSVVYTRQGNPAWATQERDGFTPIRSDDLYYGAANNDPQSDWIDLDKVAIPQADEQQRLLDNLILQMNRSKKPLPRFWYLPRMLKAVVIMTGDDHANGGTAGRFDQYIADSPPGCSVANWECVRSTSYIYPNTPLTNTQASTYNAEGFEIGLHVNTNCNDWTPSTLNNFYTQQLSQWHAAYPSLPDPTTHRTHCIVWSDWGTQPQVELNHGMRLDGTYYFWPPNWVANNPGFFTGSGMPMRYVASDGSLIDVYQATTQLTDESGQTYPFSIDTLLDRALGPEGYYGVFNVNAHTDSADSPVSDAVIASAQARGVPIIASRQMLTWLDGRNSSTFSALTWNGNTLSFTVTPGSGTTGLQAMLPASSVGGALTSLTLNGSPVTFALQTIKGVSYATFPAAAGAYSATYANDTTPPTVTGQTPAPNATGVAPGATVTATFSENLDPSTVATGTVQLRGPNNTLVTATVTYDAASHTATLTPSAALATSTTYTATLVGGATDPRIKDLAGNALAANVTWSFTTAAPPPCPCTIWPNTATPPVPSANDPNAIELGVKFRSDVSGYITGVRFYKGSANTGMHTGSLWSTSGQRLATATFSGETASGWQQVTFASPVAISANTTYIASYHTDTGGYAFSNNGFATSGVDAAPLHALNDGVDGGNGVYIYGASALPTQSYQASNYWVDVTFVTSLGPDTTPPTVTAQTPAPNATGVAPSTTVTATFSEALDPSTVNTNTVQLRGPNNTLVAATVSYNAANHVTTLTPSTALTNSTTYTATLVGGATDPRIKDVAGNALAANVTWSFTTAAPPPCPCTIWPSSATPGNASVNDGTALELGVKVRSDVAGYITGIRFYKGTQNTGTHTGSLWSTSGQRLATATFSGETASGWQQVTFATPVAVSANTTYIASYFDPTGVHAETPSGFTSAGVDTPPLHALRDGVDGGNGVYVVSGTSALPTQSYQASNYWVDVTFVTSLGPDTTPPTVTAQTPAPNATGVAPSTTVTATFSEALDPSTVNTNTVQLRGPNNTLVTATVAYDAASRTATLTPSAALVASTTYTATVVGGATDPRIKDVAGNALAANVTWSFTTAAAPSCPCSIWPASASPANANVNDGTALELGVKVRSDASGYITGIHFYKGTQNTGTHTGSLWSSSGQRLATATFTGESASGWQQVTFASPVAITANTTYIASYFDPTGIHAETDSAFASAGVDAAPLHALRDGGDGGNGVYVVSGTSAFPTQTYQSANYWVDVVFVTTLGAAPTPAAIAAQQPAIRAVRTSTIIAERRRIQTSHAATLT